MIRNLHIFSIGLLLCGCEKGRDLIREATGGMEEAAFSSPGGEMDEALKKKISRSENGVQFRRDLPFPRELTVKITEMRETEGFRVMETSVFGTQTTIKDGRMELVYVCDKTPGIFGIRIEKSRLVPKTIVEGKVADGAPKDISDLEGTSVRFSLTEEGWRTRNDGGPVDFKRVVWADSIAGSVPAQMVEAGVHPRAQWFSSTREWREGDMIVLTGSSLKILDAGSVSGKMTLVYAGEQAVGGHPCGVFEISGEMANRNSVTIEGVRQDVVTSISSGKIWASLLHPIILRQEYEAVVTLKVRQGTSTDAPAKRMQGPVSVTRSLALEERG